MTGVGKTNLALKTALSAHTMGFNVAIITTELPVPQISRRALAMSTRLSTSDMKLGRLSHWAVQRAQNFVNSLINLAEDDGPFFKILPGGMFANVDEVIIATKELQPDYLVIDGAYLLRIPGWRGNRWDRMIEVTERTKSLSLEENIPIMSTYQFKKGESGNLEGIYGGTAMSHAASILLSFEYERKEDIGAPAPVQFRILRIVKGRDGEFGTIRILYDMRNTAIIQDSVLSGSEMDYEDTEEDYMDEDPEEFAEI
jgi:replicative DNA helicase